MFSRLLALCITAASLISSQPPPPDLLQYTFTATDSRILPGKTTDNNPNSTGSDQDRIGSLALVALKYQAGNRQNHNDFPIEVGHVGVAGQEQRFEAFRLGEPLRKTIKSLNTQHSIYYRFPHKTSWVLYRTDKGFVTPVTTIPEREIVPAQYTRVLRVGADKLSGTGTYFFAPATVRVSSYPQINKSMEAARLADTQLGKLVMYRHAVDGTPPDPRREMDVITRRFFIIKTISGPGVIWQDAGTHTIYLTRFSSDLQNASTISLATERPGRLLAACADPSGNLYYLLAREQDDPEILELAKTDAHGKLLARFVPDASKNGLNIFHMKAPRVAADLQWSKGQLGMMLMRTMHKSADGLNHQGGIAVIFDAASLKQIKSLGQTSSHSFDNVLTTNSAGDFIGIDLGDAYPRGIHLHRFTDKNRFSRVVYTFKTAHATKAANPAGKTFPPYPEISRPDKTFYQWSNDNNTYTELGGLVATPQGYMVVFTGERSPEGKILDNSRTGTDNTDKRNIGLVVAIRDFHTIASRGNIVPDELLVTKGPVETGGFYCFNNRWNEQRSTGVVWLTNYTDKDGISASNIKTVGLPDGNVLILWKVYRSGEPATTWGMTVSSEGKQLIAPFRLPDQLSLNRRDAIMVDDKRVYIASGDTFDKRLELLVLQLR